MVFVDRSKRRWARGFAVLASIALLPFASLFTAAAKAQAINTAGRSAAIYAFGGVAYSQPDYGPDGYKDWGFLFGGDYDRYFRLGNHPLGVGLEGRYNHVTGEIVDESSAAGGLRINTVIFNRFHPFVNGLAGVGTIKFHFLPVPSDPSYTQDNGWLLQYGFGLDIDVTPSWAIKLDGQQQSWTLGKNSTLGPAIYSAAIVYRIPFRSYIGMNAHRHEKVKNVPPPPPPPPAPAAVTTTTTTDSSTTTTAAPPAPDTATPPPAPETTAPPASTAPATTGTANPQ